MDEFGPFVVAFVIDIYPVSDILVRFVLAHAHPLDRYAFYLDQPYRPGRAQHKHRYAFL